MSQPVSQGSRPSSPGVNQDDTAFAGEADRGQGLLSPEEVIEAKLAAVSLSAGVSIGPPPSKQPQTASYAKIVQRD